VHAWLNRSLGRLYCRSFFVLSCLSSFLMFWCNWRIVPGMGKAASLVATSLYVGMLVENLLRDLTVEQYNRRYAFKIFVVMCLTSVALFEMSRDYLLYLPVLLGMLFLNVNAIFRSPFVDRMILVYMALPAIKVLLFYPQSARLEYLSQVVLFTSVSYLTNHLFQANKSQLEESDNRAAMLQSLFGMVTPLLAHDVRNELAKMQRLALKKYRDDPDLFENVMHDHIRAITRMVDSVTLESQSPVSFAELSKELSCMRRPQNVRVSFHEQDARLFVSNRNIVHSVLANLLENSIEAAIRCGDSHHISVRKGEDSIQVEDDCGGFDPKQVVFGRSWKQGSHHGVFLRTLTDPSFERLFHFRAEIKRTNVGMSVTLVFAKVVQEENDTISSAIVDEGDQCMSM
jgi:signal transduction histidine kinase